MKKYTKFAAFVLALAALFTLCSCSTGFFADYSGSSQSGSSTESSSGAVLPSDLNFTITYVPSPEIKEGSVENVVANVRPSVLELYCIVGSSKSSGSGVIVSFDDSDNDGVNDSALVVTCHHVIDGSETITAKSIFGVEYDAELIAADPVSDIALVCLTLDEVSSFDGLTAAAMMCESDKLVIGSEVLAIGNPLGYLGGTVTKGIVSALNRDINVEGRQMTLIQTDAAINGGNSGGGLFDAKTGALIGIVNAGYKSSAAQGLSFAIPCGTVKSVTDKLLDKGYVEGNYDFGVTFDSVALYNGAWSTKTYVVVDSIDIYGSFYKGGIEEGDLILSITVGSASIDVSNFATDTLSKLDSFISNKSYAIGDKVSVTYMRYNRYTRIYEKATADFEISQYIYGII